LETRGREGLGDGGYSRKSETRECRCRYGRAILLSTRCTRGKARSDMKQSVCASVPHHSGCSHGLITCTNLSNDIVERFILSIQLEADHLDVSRSAHRICPLAYVLCSSHITFEAPCYWYESVDLLQVDLPVVTERRQNCDDGMKPSTQLSRCRTEALSLGAPRCVNLLASIQHPRQSRLVINMFIASPVMSMRIKMLDVIQQA
jgi:hypothetical protein